MIFRIAILSTFLTLSVNLKAQIDVELLNEYRGRYLGDYSYWLTCNQDSNLYHNDTIVFTANYPICDESFGLEFKKLRIKGVGGYKDPYRLVYPKKIAKFYKKETNWYLRLLVIPGTIKLLKLIELTKKRKENTSKYAYEIFQYKMIFVVVKNKPY